MATNIPAIIYANEDSQTCHQNKKVKYNVLQCLQYFSGATLFLLNS